MKTYPAVVLAGYSPDKADPLALAVGAERKSLIDVAGKPMVYWVVQALNESERVDGIIVVGMGPEEGVDFGVDVHYVPNQTTQLDNIMAGVKAVETEYPDATYVVAVSADVPLLRSSTVDWFVAACEARGGDFFYSIIEKEVMEEQYPSVARSYVPIADGRFCGGDLFFVDPRLAVHNEQIIRDLLERRKSAFQQVRLAGISTLIKFLFRRVTLVDAEEIASRVFACEARAIVSPYADLGMDCDKPHQLEMARQIKEAAA